jgi:hypothetical protein
LKISISLPSGSFRANFSNKPSDKTKSSSTHVKDFCGIKKGAKAYRFVGFIFEIAIFGQ